MIDANADRRQPKAHRRDATEGTGRAAIRNPAIDGIGAIPEVVEAGLLDIIEEFVVARERMREGGQRYGRETFLGGGELVSTAVA